MVKKEKGTSGDMSKIFGLIEDIKKQKKQKKSLQRRIWKLSKDLKGDISHQKKQFVYTDLGDIYREIGDIGKAKKFYEKAMEIHNEYSRSGISKDLLGKYFSVGGHGMAPNAEYYYSFLSIGFFVLALLFVSLSFTGFAIGNTVQNNSSWISFCFFICGLIFALIYFKKKRDNFV